MNVKVKFLGIIRDITKGSELELQMPEGATIRGLLQELNRKYGQDFADRVLDDHLGVRTYVKLFLNNYEVTDLDTEIIADGPAANALLYVMPGSTGGTSS